METLIKGYNLTLPVNNFNLSYDDVGEGRIPIIFLHGYPFDKTTWKLQLDFLKSSHRVIACDIRGFGKSTDEKSHLSIDVFGDDLITFMNKLFIQKAIVCGLSMGGFIALNVQKRFPDRLEALILCDTQCIADTMEIKEKRYKILDEIETGGTADFKEAFLKSVFHKDSLTHKKERVEELRTVVSANPEQSIKRGLAALAERTSTCSTLQDITIPTLILCGREDEVTPLAQSEFMHEKITGSILHIIEDAGHVSNLEQPDVFNTHLRDFLASLNTEEAKSLSWNQKIHK